MRDVGRMGESAFCQWCASAGLTANSSNVDKTGWDFIVEFAFARRHENTFGSVHDAALECKVQVKSTDKRDRKLAIKLSNLKRLVTSAMPSFFVFIEFDGMEQAQRVFLVHVDQKIAYSVLARLQEAESKNESHLLHKKTLVVKYDESNLISEPTGLALAEAIRKHVGDDLASYINEKTASYRPWGSKTVSPKLHFRPLA